MSIYEYIILNLSKKDAIILFIKGFFIYGKHFYSQQFWFILSSIYGLLFLWILIDILKINKYLASWITLIIYLIALNVFEDYKISRIFLGAVYILAGFLLKTREDEKRILFEIIICIIAGIIKYTINYTYVPFIANVIMSMCIFSILLNIKWIRRDNSFLRKISMCIYYIHTYIIFGIETIFRKKHSTFGWKIFLATLTVSFIISAFYIYISKKYRKIVSTKKVDTFQNGI